MGRAFTVTCDFLSERLTVTVCRYCLDGIIGRPGRLRLDHVMSDTGWTQIPLPEDLPRQSNLGRKKS